MKPSRRTVKLVAAVLASGAALVAATSATGRTAVAPENTKSPVITNPYRATVGTSLSGNRGTWSGTSPVEFTQQWLRCNDDAEACKSIPGENETSYTVTSDDLDRTIRFSVTGTNADGKSTALSDPTNVIDQATTKAPVETAAPAVSGDAVVGGRLTATTGSWVGTQPITFTTIWQRCDAAITSCAATGSRGSSYTVASSDTGQRLRVKVIAENSAGQTAGLSDATAVVKQAAGGGGGGGNGGDVITLPNGEKSIPVASVGKGERLIVDQVTFNPSTVVSRSPINVRIKVKDTENHVVRGALVFIRSTPLVASVPTDAPTGTDGWVSYTLTPESDFPIRDGYSVQFFVKAYRQGDPTLAGISGTRLVQVKTATS
jgi:hypothetical protein